MDQLELCRFIATVAHAAKGQFRADGITPYIEHPRRVATLIVQWDDAGIDHGLRSSEARFACGGAWLHDVVEDTGVTPAHLRVWGVAARTIEIVELLTKENAAHEAETREYYAAIACDASALLVKCADRSANIEDALAEVKRGNGKRWRKYVERTYSDVLPLYESLPELRAELVSRLKAIEDAMLVARGGDPHGTFDCGDFRR